MWMDHDDRPRWAEGWDWDGGYGYGYPVPSPLEQEASRATRARRAQADARYQRWIRREQRAVKYEEIDLHLQQRATDPTTVLQIEKCYKTIISRALENGKH